MVDAEGQYLEKGAGEWVLRRAGDEGECDEVFLPWNERLLSAGCLAY